MRARLPLVGTAVVAATTAALFATAPAASAASGPTVKVVSPNAGSTAGGSTVTITGSGFSHVTAVRFATTAGSSVHVLSTGKLTVRAPKHAAGRVDVRVVTSAGTSPLGVGDRYTYVAPPAVTSLKPSDGPDAGGTQVTVLGASFSRVTKVTFGGVVATGLHVDSTGSLTVTAPAHATGAVDVQVATAYGTSSAVAADRFTYDASPGHWSSSMVDPSHYRPTGVSCASVSFCVAVDAFGSAFVHTNLGWGAPMKVVAAGSLSVTELTAVSCVLATTRCVAVGYGGRAATFDGTTWTPAPVPAGPNLTAISCPTTTFCLATGAAEGQAYAFDGTSWSALGGVGDTNVFTSVACAAATSCVLGDDAGSVVEYAGGSSWSAPVAVIGPGASQVSAVACVPGGTFCMESDDAGWTRTSSDGHTWGTLQRDNFPGGDVGLSCPAPSWCAAVGSGSVAVYAGSWSISATQFDPPMEAVSCPSTAFCLTLGPDGYSANYKAGMWVSDGTAFDTPAIPVGLSCPSASFCAEVDVAGQVRTSSSGAWTDPQQPDPQLQLASVSCATAEFCVAVGSGVPDLLVFASGTWSVNSVPSRSAQAPVFVSVACPALTFCAAVTADGEASLYDGTGWSYPGAIDGNTPLIGVACASPRRCVAVDGSSRVLTWNGAFWSSPTYVDGARSISAVSCAPAGGCLAVDQSGNAIAFDGSQWATPVNVAGTSPLFAVSCLASGMCYALTDDAVVAVLGSWHARQAVAFAGQPSALSCMNGPRCTALDWSGDVTVGV